MSAKTELEVHGGVAPGWGAVMDAFRANFEHHGDVGAACCVYLDGHPVVDIWGGAADREAGRPWTRDTMALTFSSTKGATAVCANRLIQEGRLDPDAAVAEYWPEFAANGKATIPVRWVLSHRAGLAAVDGDFTFDDVVAWDPIVNGLAAQAPQWEPGSKYGYHARSFGWLTGEIVRRVTGRSLGRYFADEVAGPLGLDFFIGLPEREEPRVARLYPAEFDDPEVKAFVDAMFADRTSLMGRVMSGPSNLFAYDDRWNTRPFHAAEMPSSNGIGDARSLARLYAACIGDVEGVRLLDADTVAKATVPQTEGTDAVLGMEMVFGLGFGLQPLFGSDAGRRTFGHAGAGGSLGYADPDAGIAFGYVMNQMQLGTIGDERSAGLTRAAYSALD